MKIKLATSLADERKNLPVGTIVDTSESGCLLSDDDARRLLQRGLATPVRDEVVETTTRSAPETTDRTIAQEQRGKLRLNS